VTLGSGSYDRTGMSKWRYQLWDRAGVIEFIWINSRWHDRVEPHTPGPGCTRLCSILSEVVEALYLPKETT